MASDISTVKSTIVTDGAIASAKGSAQSNGTGINFADIVRKNGARTDGGLNALSDRAGITGVGERSDNPPLVAERPQDSNSDNRDHGGNRAEGDEHSDRPSDRDISSQPEHSRDYDGDHSQNTGSQTAETASEARETPQAAENNGENASRDDRPDDSSGDDTASSTESGGEETVEAAAGGDDQQAAAKGESENKEVAENNGGDTTNAKQMLNTLLANAEGAAFSGQASSQGQESNNSAGSGKVNATEGLNTAIANVGKQAEGESVKSGQSGATSGNAQAQGQTHNLGNSQNQNQNMANSGAAAQAAGEGQARDTTKIADQAAQISKLVGNGNKVEVSVTVTDDKSTLISKPSANLTASSVLAADSTAPSLRSKQTQANSKIGRAHV